MTPKRCEDCGGRCDLMTRRDMIQDIATYVLLVLIVACGIAAAVFGIPKDKTPNRKPKSTFPIRKTRFHV